jgi:SAM-dependent methyltransferase
MIMKNSWEEFALRNAEGYILVGDIDYRTDEGMAYFRASGEQEAAQILSEVGPYLRRRSAVLEIGCGVGRIGIPMARQFDRFTGVDISPTMLKLLARNCESEGVFGVQGYLPHEPWWQGGPFDLVYSRIAFQHVEDLDVIEDYFEGVSRCLAPSGIFYAHFDTRPPDLLYSVRRLLPDFVLPRLWRKGIRRVRRSRVSLVQAAARRELEIRAELRPNGEEHVFIFGLSPNRSLRP